MFKVTERVYRTVDGRLVRHGDPTAAFLAFPAGMELSDEEARRSGLLELMEKSRRPADKMAPRPRDKALRADTKEQDNG